MGDRSEACVEAARRYRELEEHPLFCQEIERVLASRSDKDSDLADRFYRDLDFGTGGLRGVIGAGFNRINPYTISRATLGLIRYIQSADPAVSGSTLPGSADSNSTASMHHVNAVVFAFDSRRFSPEFAESAALVCAAAGVKAYVFEALRPTPELSFAVRVLGATAGVVITASHNPPEYNGYKVYWSDGGQIVPPQDSGIIREVRKISGPIPSISKSEAKALGLFEVIGANIDEAFASMVGSYVRRSELIGERVDFSVIYTPLHGAGTLLVEKVFQNAGIRCTTVPAQRDPDGEFPTVASPNPEEPDALAMAVDPDADRLGIAVRTRDGEYQLINGNQLGSMLSDYLLRTRVEFGEMPERPVLIKTIVTTDLQRRIAESYGATVYDVLTGFKYIGEKIRLFESSGEHYIFGAEESYGFLVETEVRDKDSVSAALLTAEMAIWCASRGITIVDYLDEIYERFGFFDELLASTRFEGEAGAVQMAELIDRLRSDPPSTFAGLEVVEIRDYQGRVRIDNRTGGRFDLDLPKSNVLQFRLPTGAVTVRPSGTEPKIKFYASCWSDPGRGLVEAKTEVRSQIEAIRAQISQLA